MKKYRYRSKEVEKDEEPQVENIAQIQKMKEKLRSVIAAQGDISVDRIIGLQDTSPLNEEKISYEGYKGYSRTKAKKEPKTINTVRKP